MFCHILFQLSRLCDSSVAVLMIELYWEDGVQPAQSNFSVEVVQSKIALSVFPYKGGYIHLPFWHKCSPVLHLSEK